MCGRCGDRNNCKRRKDKCSQTFVALLDGSQEVPPVNTTGRGVVRAFLHQDNQLVVKGHFENLSSDYDSNIGSHIHFQVPGKNGPIVRALNVVLFPGNRSGKFKGSQNVFQLTDNEATALRNREYYINIHTVAYPGGEIRGQLLHNASKYFIVNLSGNNEVPPVNTTGTGTVLLELCNNRLTLVGSFDNLGSAPVAAHIHEGVAGVNGPVLFELFYTPDGSVGGIFPANRNVYTLTCAQRDLLFNGGLYINVHSVNTPSGEIRGQILKLH